MAEFLHITYHSYLAPCEAVRVVFTVSGLREKHLSWGPTLGPLHKDTGDVMSAEGVKYEQ